ncbi:MAG: phage holin family protein [Candidatus Paceibacterota bacterium]
MNILINWLIMAIAVIVSAYILPGVTLSGFGAALLVALVLGLLNVFIKPLLLILTLPINILTLGLFTLVINAAIILMASAIVPGFKVAGFWYAMLFSIVLSIILYLINKAK